MRWGMGVSLSQGHEECRSCLLCCALPQDKENLALGCSAVISSRAAGQPCGSSLWSCSNTGVMSRCLPWIGLCGGGALHSALAALLQKCARTACQEMNGAEGSKNKSMKDRQDTYSSMGPPVAAASAGALRL